MNAAYQPYIPGGAETTATDEAMKRAIEHKTRARMALEPGQIVNCEMPGGQSIEVEIVEGWPTDLYGMVYRIRLADGSVVKCTGERLSVKRRKRRA